MRNKIIMTLALLLTAATGAWANVTSTVQGDANGDGVVDVADIAAIVAVMIGDADYDNADVNTDGSVNIADIAYVQNIMAQQSASNATGTAAITANAITAVNGGDNVDVVINLDYQTASNVVGASFTLYLPDGLLLKGFDTVEAQGSAKASALKKACDLGEDGVWGDDVDNDWLTIKVREDGGIQFTLIDNDVLTPFESTQSKLITIQVHAVADVQGQAYIRNVSLASEDNASLDKGNLADSNFGVNEATITASSGTAVPLTWDAATNTGTFAMPAYNVEIAPIYAAATIYSGQTETPFETLKEAFAAVKSGDVIKLDWNVTLTEYLQTPTIDGGAKFTLDFNGYTIDGGTTYQIQLKNAGDQLTFIDSSDDQLGGLIAQDLNAEAGSEFVFDAGRYNFSGATAEKINGFCANASIPLSLAEGKEFVDLEGGAAANDGFTMRVGFKTFELTIGPKKFATFYADKNITFAEQPAEGVGLYTISGIDTDHSMATVTMLSGIIPAGTPMLVYNGTEQEQTAKLIVTLDNVQNAVDWAPEFKGTATDREFTADDMAANNYFALSGGKAFAPVYKPGTIGANKCWLEFAKQQTPGARQLTIVFDNEATGIQTSKFTKETNSEWYTIDGRKVTAPTKKGVYIQNGKKVVIK